jgi:hypothetical protein
VEEDRDTEAIRRARNQRRRQVRRRRRRATWLEEVHQREPETAERLEELRRAAPHAFRKELVRVVRRMGFYSLFEGFGPRELDPLEERRGGEDGGDNEDEDDEPFEGGG